MKDVKEQDVNLEYMWQWQLKRGLEACRIVSDKYAKFCQPLKYI